jgi:hypothetical protein
MTTPLCEKDAVSMFVADSSDGRAAQDAIDAAADRGLFGVDFSDVRAACVVRRESGCGIDERAGSNDENHLGARCRRFGLLPDRLR